ncbi:hypothetical protein JVU11DRAFT_777 [Chiua virens]|nr:hypothetical protein JVU11DRAFT_777 [Chiua virens]
MSDNIEMDELSRSHAKTSVSAEPPLEPEAGTTRRAGDDGSTSVWAWSSAIVFALFSICLLAFPRFLLFLAKPSGGRGTLTALEKFLAQQLGIILGALAITIIAVLPNEWPTGLQRRTDPNCHPLLRPVTAASLVMALLAYENTSVGALSTTVLLGSGVVGLLGLWVVRPQI